MELEKASSGDDQPDLASYRNGGSPDPPQPYHCLEDVDSTCSTPYVSAPSSPGRGVTGAYFFSAPASPMHFVLSSSPFAPLSAVAASSSAESFEFEFSSRCPSPGAGGEGGSMISADELFLNGQIRPMKLSSHLQRPQVLAPLLDLDEEDEDSNESRGVVGSRGWDLRLRSASTRRRARSLSPLRNLRFQWAEDIEAEEDEQQKRAEADPVVKHAEGEDDAPMPSSGSASSSRSSSSGRNSKRWIFLKDLLYRSKSEGRERERVRGNAMERFWHSISFSPASSSKGKSKPVIPPPPPLFSSSTTTTAPPPRPAAALEATKSRQKSGASSASATGTRKAVNGVAGWKRRGPAPSAHERHYTSNRAQAEEMRRRTFLPYRQGLLGCLGFSSRTYGAMNGLAKTLNPVSSRYALSNPESGLEGSQALFVGRGGGHGWSYEAKPC